MKYGDLLRSLRQMKGMTQKELAEKLSISPSTVGMYEQNRRIPDIATLSQIAQIFSVSVDFMLGLEKSGGDDYSNFQLFDCTFDFKERVKALMTEQSMSEEVFMEKTGFSKELKDAYLYGNRIPTIEDLIKISGVLRVSTDYLLDTSQKKRISPEETIILNYYDQYPDEIMDLLSAFCSLNRKQRAIVIGKCFELEVSTTVAADDSPLKKASGK